MAHLVVALVPPSPGALIFDCILCKNSTRRRKNEKQSEMKNATLILHKVFELSADPRAVED